MFLKIVAMRKYLSGWVETKSLKKADSKNVAAFIHEWIRFGVPGMIIHANGSENHKIAKELLERYRINNVSIASYHPQSMELLNGGHQPIVDALAKLNNNCILACSSALTFPTYTLHHRYNLAQ